MTIHVLGGGTFSHVRNHLALAAPAFGTTARAIYEQVSMDHLRNQQPYWAHPQLHLTKMADPKSNLVTNEDVDALLDKLIADPDTKIIFMNVALCDYIGKVIETRHGEETLTASGKYATRLKTSDGDRQLWLTPAAKLIGKIRKERKDIFVVGFKTTCGATSDEQYITALNMLKANSINLVLANDTLTRNNMIVAPEETRYHESTDRAHVLEKLVEMTLSRSTNTFTRSTVVPGELVAWNSDQIPDNLRRVVNHCIERGAYKPFRGATAGHFAVKVSDNEILTSVRKSNFNDLADNGLVRVEYEGLDKVIAYGAKPSVGGQSQRIIFDEHPDAECIVHFHCPLEDINECIITAPQEPNECGSHQCGANTSRELHRYRQGQIKAVMLDKHGPNIVFNRNTDPELVIDFIEHNWDLSQKTGGLVDA